MHPSFASLRAALFDLDGTLVRTHIDFAGLHVALRDLCAAFGAREAVEGERDLMQMIALASAAMPEERRARFVRDAHTMLTEWEAAGCAHPEEIDGAEELLRRLPAERGVRIAVITRNARRVAATLARSLPLPPDAVLIAREDTPEFKPHPAPLLRACERLGIAPSETSMTGDYWPDVAAGRAAGVAVTVGIHWPADGPDRFARAKPDFEVTSLREAVGLFLGEKSSSAA